MDPDEQAMKRVDAAVDEAMQAPTMTRILMDVNDPVLVQKIADAFVEGARCGADAMGQEVMAHLNGGRNG